MNWIFRAYPFDKWEHEIEIGGFITTVFVVRPSRVGYKMQEMLFPDEGVRTYEFMNIEDCFEKAKERLCNFYDRKLDELEKEFNIIDLSN